MKKRITEDRILQVTNDIAEDMAGRATKDELMAVAGYWMKKCDEWNALHQKRMSEVSTILQNHLKEMHP